MRACLTSLYALGCLSVLPSSKRGTVHLTARKITHILAIIIFVKLPIFADGLFSSFNKFIGVGPRL